MQSMMCDSRRLFRYYPDGLVSPNFGGAVANWKKSTRSYRVSFTPLESSREKTEFGHDDEITWLAIVNNAGEFALGDRLGSATEQLYEITKIKSFRTNQQMEVREIARNDC